MTKVHRLAGCQRVQLLALACAACTLLTTSVWAQALPKPPPIDTQKVQDQDDMTWADYKPIPNTSWADPDRKPTTRGLRVALIAIDFSDQDFVITKPRHSDPFGNPQIDPIKREEVPKWLVDFWHKPGEVNHGQTIHGYWMEQSRGKYGISAIDAFGPYRMPRPLWSYGLAEHRQQNSTPDGSVARSGMEADCDALWRADQGSDIRERGLNNSGRYDQILRIYAGYDETGVWQEFGEMKFETRDDITPEWGNPNPELPRWVPTRYVPWTSWLAGMQQWGLSSIRQGENSGTIPHELGHSFFSTGDNNNNPYVQPFRRVGSGPWDMMDRGCFNGPGGPHTRWQVPVIAGGSMPAGLMLRQRINFGFLSPQGAARPGARGRGGAARGGDTPDNAPTAPTPGWANSSELATQIPTVLFLSREGLAKSGLALGRVVARAVDPGPGTLAGIIIRFDGEPVPLVGRGTGRGARGGAQTSTTFDRSPWVDPATDPLSQGLPSFNYYSLEVVQRIGYDSFCPDSGVLVAKNKDGEGDNGGVNGFNCFNWVIDAHPQDINVVDYKKPTSGTPVMRTIADFRQLNDALFHAGLNSGGHYEWEDSHNRLKFYIVDTHKDNQGILSYTLAVRSLDGNGPHTRGVTLNAPAPQAVREALTRCEFTLANTGSAAPVDRAWHPSDASRFVNADVYRLSVTVEGAGWAADLQNALAALSFGGSDKVPVFVSHAPGSAPTATVTLKAVSESDPTKSATAVLQVTAN